MGIIPTGREIWRKYEIDGVPASGPNPVDKGLMQSWSVWAETMFNSGIGARVYATLAALNSDLSPGANTSAMVYNDTTPGANGVYAKTGASGAGSWTRIGDLPVSIVPLTVTGGTANAIVATAPETPTLPGRKLFLLTPAANNTAATTLAYNGGSAVAIKSALGSDLVPGNLIAGVQVVMAWQTDHFQLLLSTAVDAQGVLNDVLTARDDAAASAAEAAADAALLGNQVHQYDTRAAAIAATIPAGVNFVRTLAYDSSFTENSGALFKRVAAGTPFTDTWPLTCTITGGSGYTNGTYYGMVFTSSATGHNLVATVTISGGSLSAVDFSTQPGNAYKVGDVLTFVGLGSGGSVGAGTGASITIATISSPLASFVNTVDSSRWQYMVSKGRPHVNEFGAKPDYISTDAAATNSMPGIQAALFYSVANFTGTSADSSGYFGNIVWAGVGSYMLQQPSNSTSLIVPNGVFLEGCYGTTLKFHDAWYAATHCVCLGNPNAHFANFDCGLRNLVLFFRIDIAAALGTYMVYSNNIQDGGGIDHVAIFAGLRGGIKYEIGYGGASFVYFHKIRLNWQGINPAAQFNVGTTVVDCKDWSVGAPSVAGNTTVNGIELIGTGGMFKFDGVHIEGSPVGILVNLQAGNNSMAKFVNITGGFGMNYLFSLASTNEAGNVSLECCQINNGSGIALVQNGQSGGVNRSGNVRPKDGIVYFNP